MRKSNLVIGILLAVSLSGCASLGTGPQATDAEGGALLGALAGAVIGNQTGSPLAGAAIGAGIGGLAGNAVGSKR
ncbi:YMGG-like glycine zipper-containing protein [Acidithiobacillus sp.]|uniref:YMGG-like glycine zipper-containing protein n=1 Tax=Acidithiobacillus sp. TaxID=1872118 RepID=UPI003D058DB4